MAVIFDSFCLTLPILCDYDIEGKGLLLLCISKWLRRDRDNRVKVSALLRAGYKVSEVDNPVYAIKKRMDDGEGVKERAGNGRKTVIPRMATRKLSVEWHPASAAVSRMASRKLSRSTIVFRPLPACLLTPSQLSICFLR